MADVIERAAKGKLDPVYILSSEQPLLVQRAVAAILEAAVPPASRGFNYDIIEGKNPSVSRIVAAAQTLPMMAQRRMVLVRDLAGIPSSELLKLLDYIKAPNPSSVLVAISSKVDKRLKFYQAAKKQKVLHDLSPPKQLSRWVAAEARARRVAIDPGACSRLVDVVGKDLARLTLALDQLGLYAGDRSITSDDVDDLVADTRERSVFELTEAIGRGHLGRALAAVSALCEQRQSAIGVVVMLSRHMRQIGLCHGALAQSVPKPQLAKTIGVPPFVVNKLMAQSRRYPATAIPVALSKLSRADRALKGQGGTVKVLGRQLGERVILDRLVTDLIGLGG